ncbi:MAG: cytochrome P450, partial [Chloroflexota bacterium]
YVLQTNNRNYIKGPLMDKVRTAAGNGLFTSEGDFWRRQRRLMQPGFHRQRIATFGGIMVEETDALILDWSTRTAPFTLDNDMTRLALRIVARALFTTSLTEADLVIVRETITPLLEEINRRARRPFSLRERLPLPENRAFDDNLTRIDALIHHIITTRRNADETYDDLLQMLIDIVDEDTGERMTDAQLRDEVITLFVAGHETTATALTWVFKLLADHPDVLARLQAEVDSVLGQRPPTAADYPNLPYTLAVFEETMRLYPPLRGIVRYALKDDVVGGYPVPAGSNVIVPLYALHRHPDFWPDPETFDPTRFLPEQSAGRHRFAYLPFGMGPRFCIGAPFARLEATLALARITQQVTVDPVPGQVIGMRGVGTLRPDPGVEVTIHPRRG